MRRVRRAVADQPPGFVAHASRDSFARPPSPSSSKCRRARRASAFSPTARAAAELADGLRAGSRRAAWGRRSRPSAVTQASGWPSAPTGSPAHARRQTGINRLARRRRARGTRLARDPSPPPYGELLVELARESFFERLAGVHLPPGNSHSPGDAGDPTLLEQHAARLREHAGRHEQDLPLPDAPAAAAAIVPRRLIAKRGRGDVARFLAVRMLPGCVRAAQSVPQRRAVGRSFSFIIFAPNVHRKLARALLRESDCLAAQSLLAASRGQGLETAVCESKGWPLRCCRRNCASSGHPAIW